MSSKTILKIGFGGGCHWCTEAYFQSLRGVTMVEQGWIAALPPNDAYSEAVIVHYDPEIMPLQILIAVHLHTHAATKAHTFRKKYRSAVYVLEDDMAYHQDLIAQNQPDFEEPILTQALAFHHFKPNIEKQQNYYQKNKEAVFCHRYISPKLQLIHKNYTAYFKPI